MDTSIKNSSCFLSYYVGPDAISKLEQLRQTDQSKFDKIINECIFISNGKSWIKPIVYVGRHESFELFKYLYQFIPNDGSYIFDKFDMPLLHQLVVSPNCMKCIKFLVEEKKIDINVLDKFGRTCLFCFNGPYFDYFEECNIDMDKRDCFNEIAVVFRMKTGRFTQLEKFLPRYARLMLTFALELKNVELLIFLVRQPNVHYTSLQLYEAYRFLTSVSIFTPGGLEWPQRLNKYYSANIPISDPEAMFQYLDNYYILRCGKASIGRMLFLESMCLNVMYNNEAFKNTRFLAFEQWLNVILDYPLAADINAWNPLVMTRCVAEFCPKISNRLQYAKDFLSRGRGFDGNVVKSHHLIFITHWLYACWQILMKETAINNDEYQKLIEMIATVAKVKDEKGNNMLYYCCDNPFIKKWQSNWSIDWINLCIKAGANIKNFKGPKILENAFIIEQSNKPLKVAVKRSKRGTKRTHSYWLRSITS